jgi:hypothetical protein
VNAEVAPQAVPVQTPTLRTSDKLVEFTRITQPVPVATVPTADTVVPTARVNAKVAAQAVPVQTPTPRTSDKSVEFTRATQPVAAATVPMSDTVVPTARMNAEVVPQNTVISTPRVAAAVTSQTVPVPAVMPRTSDTSVKLKPSTQPAQVATTLAQNMHAPVTEIPHAVPGRVTTLSAFNAEAEVLKSYSSLPELKGMKLEQQEVSELTSALPASIPSGESATMQRASLTPHQEQSTSIPQAIKQQAEVLAVRDKNAEVPKETKISLAWGNDQAVYISGTSETGYKLRTSDDQVKHILMSQGGELPSGISSVESSIDKQPKQRQSPNQHHVDDADE